MQFLNTHPRQVGQARRLPALFFALDVVPVSNPARTGRVRPQPDCIHLSRATRECNQRYGPSAVPGRMRERRRGDAMAAGKRVFFFLGGRETAEASAYSSGRTVALETIGWAIVTGPLLKKIVPRLSVAK